MSGDAQRSSRPFIEYHHPLLGGLPCGGAEEEDGTLKNFAWWVPLPGAGHGGKSWTDAVSNRVPESQSSSSEP
jgi:hypothetical protein